jgi:hypothetical protein
MKFVEELGEYPRYTLHQPRLEPLQPAEVPHRQPLRICRATVSGWSPLVTTPARGDLHMEAETQPQRTPKDVVESRVHTERGPPNARTGSHLDRRSVRQVIDR